MITPTRTHPYGLGYHHLCSYYPFFFRISGVPLSTLCQYPTSGLLCARNTTHKGLITLAQDAFSGVAKMSKMYKNTPFEYPPPPPVFLDSRLEHPAEWIYLRYKSSVLLLYRSTTKDLLLFPSFVPFVVGLFLASPIRFVHVFQPRTPSFRKTTKYGVVYLVIIITQPSSFITLNTF